METIQLPWPVSKLDDASLDIKATLEAVGNAVKAVPTENTDLVQRAVEGSVAIMQKIAARDDFGDKKDSYTKPQFRKLCNLLAEASDDLADDITIKNDQKHNRDTRGQSFDHWHARGHQDSQESPV